MTVPTLTRMLDVMVLGRPAVRLMAPPRTAPVLMARAVRSLDDRIVVLRELVWGNGPSGPAGSLRDPLMRQVGLAVTRACPPRGDECELRAIFEFIVRNVRYTGDITDKDTFQTALRTLQYGGGDCDDSSVLSAVLGMENGFRWKWRITSNTGATWDHIYGMAGIPKHRPARWVALDTTIAAGKPWPMRYFGVEPPRAKFRDFSADEKG